MGSRPTGTNGGTFPRGFSPAQRFPWPLVRAETLVELRYGKSLTKDRRQLGPIPVYGTNGVAGWHDQALFAGPGVILGRKGMGPLGVEWCEGDYWVIDTAYTVRPLTSQLDLKFFFYLIKYVGLNHLKDGTSNPSLSRETFGAQLLPLPPLSEQRAIASVLSALDAMIELNGQTNRTLEAIARAIFKSWFVDFDPVRARMEARPPILPAELVDHFPDRLVESPIGPVPEGWGVAPLGEHVEVVRGLSYRGADLADEGMPLHNLNSVLEGGGYKYDGTKYYAGEYKERHLVEPGDVIVANTEQGHQYLLIGYPAIVAAVYGNEGLFSHHLYRVRPRAQSPVTRRYLYLLFLSSRLRQEITAYTHGTTVNMLSIEGLRRPRFVAPPRELIDAFDRLVGPMFELVEGLVAESGTLAKTRDWLLPRLVSGRVRVRDKETLEAAT